MDLNAFAKLISRAVSVYLLVEATFLLVELPQALLSLLHHAYYVHLAVTIKAPTQDGTFWAAYDFYNLARIVVLLAICLLFAYQFYAAGPRIMKYLLGGDAHSEDETQSS